MLNPLLEHQLADLGIEATQPPTLEQWEKLLGKISGIYTDYQAAEVDLRQSEMLYQDLYNSTWRQTQELSLLVRVRESLVNKLQVKEVIRTVVEATSEAFGYALVSIYLLRDDVLHLQHQVGYDSLIEQMPINKGIMGRVARTGQAALAEDCRSDPDFIAAVEGLISEVCVPIRNNRQVVGVLNVETRFPQQLTTNDLEMMSTLSEHVGIAMERAHLHMAVQESNQKYQRVVDNISEVIFQVDIDGYITFLNPAWFKLSGHTVENSLGKHFATFVVPDAIGALTTLQNLLVNGDQFETRFQSKLLRPDGSSIPIEARLQRILDPAGEFMGLGGTAVDISDRRQAEIQAREMSLLVRVQDAISSKLDLKDMISTIVEATAATFGYELVSVYLLYEDMLYLQHAVGYETVITKFPITEGIAGRVIRTQKPVFIEDAKADPDFLFAFDGIVSEICVPMINDGQAIGALVVEAKEANTLTSVDLKMMITLGEQVSIAVERARLYTALQESNQKYQMVVDSVREIIFHTDLKGNITFLNKAWERITGYTVEESMGKSFAAYVTVDHIEALQQQGREFFQSAQPYTQIESQILRSDRTSVPIESQLQRIYDTEGQLIGIGGTAADISQRVQAQKHEQEMNLLVQVRAAISSQLDLKDTIRTIVEVTAETFGYDLVGVYLLRGNTLYLQHEVGYEIKYDPVDISVGVSGRVARTGQPVLVQNTKDDPDFVDAINASTSEVCVPLLNKGNVIGIMNVECRGSTKLTESDLKTMIALSEHVSIAVERAQLYTAVMDSNQKYEMVVNNVQEVIFQLDPEGIFTFLNQSWTALSGYSLQDSLGKHFSSFMHPDDVEESERIGALLYHGDHNDVRYQHTLVRSDNTSVPVEIRMQLVYNTNGELMGIGGTATDVRERLQAEKQALDLILQTRTVEMLKDFLTGVSHDLRTPLSIMNTSLYLLRHKLGDEAGNNRHIEALERQTEHMQHVVEDMLDMSKLDDQSAELTLIRIDINGLIRDLLVTLKTYADEKHQEIIFSPNDEYVFIAVDQFMMGKVVTNIIRNAVQYTPEGGSININTYNGNNSTVTIAVKDSGIGIDDDTLPHIFDRFYKADLARPTGHGGTGLGLSIARKIVEMHKGSITATSRLGEGSTFIITLPIE